MLNTRNVVAAAVTLMLVSLIGAALSLLGTPGGGGLGIDSYGTRAHGLRGLFDILAELHVAVERAGVPPNRLLDRRMTLALIEPNAEIVSTEPAYLHAVGKWVRTGGTVVVSPGPKPWQIPLRSVALSRNVLPELGLQGVSVRLLAPESNGRSNSDSDRSEGNLNADARRAARDFKRIFGRQPEPPASIVHATAEGSLAPLFPRGLDLMMPDQGRCVLDSESDDASSEKAKKTQPVEQHKGAPTASSLAKAPVLHPTVSQPEAGEPVVEGRIRAVLEPEGEPETLAAVYAVGDGTITVLADPRLAQNRFVGRADNAVLISHLLADAHKPVVFDEFYHGLTVRANPLWLLSRFPYDILAASVLAATVLVGWRAAKFLGPPLSPRPASRRTLSEYIEAMARLLNRSQRPTPFLLSEIRHGLLWRIRHDLGLPPGQEDAEKIVRILQRRDADLAEKARDAIRAIDDSLARPNQSAKQLETTLAKVSLCVPRHAV